MRGTLRLTTESFGDECILTSAQGWLEVGTACSFYTAAPGQIDSRQEMRIEGPVPWFKLLLQSNCVLS